MTEIQNDVVKAQLLAIQECAYEIDREKLRLDAITAQREKIKNLFIQINAVYDKNINKKFHAKEELKLLEENETHNISMLRGKLLGLEKAVNILSDAFDTIYGSYEKSLTKGD